jgi:hypothetical protein
MTEAEVQAMPGFDDRTLPLASTKSSQKSPHAPADTLDNDSDNTKRTY